MKDKDLEVILSPLDDIKAKAVKKAYKEMEDSLTIVNIEYNEVIGKEITTEVSGDARSLRLRISKVRIDGEKWKTREKAQYNEAGNVIQTLYNKLRDETLKREAKLKTIEEHFENLEKDRITKIKSDRLAALEPYNVDSTFVDLGNMPEKAWEAHFDSIKSAHQKAIDDEKKEAENKIIDELYEKRKLLLMPYAQFNPFMDLLPNTPQKDFDQLLEDMKKLKKDFDKKQERILEENASLKKANTLLKENSKINTFKKDDLFGSSSAINQKKEDFATNKESSVNELMGFEETSETLGEIIPEEFLKDNPEPVFSTNNQYSNNPVLTDKEILKQAASFLENFLKDDSSKVIKTALNSCINTLYGAAFILK